MANVVFDGWGWCWEDEGRREVGLKLKKLNFNIQQVNMSCDHVHT